MYDPRLSGLPTRVGIPTGVVWGREDRLVPLDCGQVFQKAVPGSDLVVINNWGHVLQAEKPGDIIKTALEFLALVSRQRLAVSFQRSGIRITETAIGGNEVAPSGPG
ncbi:MAG: alpha/beta hydrolase [Chloroflexi bacterium]|nr:alpha/beta hydrolase [Chloroflexota bacterium]